MTRVVKKDGLVFVTQLSDLERREVQKIVRSVLTDKEKRDRLTIFLQRRGFEITAEDKHIYAWA